MKFSNYLVETKSSPLIVVDVQPAYKSYITFDVEELMQFINERTGKVLFLVNAEETGVTEDTANGCWNWWWENGLELDKRDRKVSFYDKGYGYFRAWMDFTDERTLIKGIRYMHQKKANDSRDIEPEEWKKVLGSGWNDYMEDDPLIINWISLKLLKEHSGGYICGGGRNECLREVTLYMNAFNLRTKLINNFIY